MKRLDRAATAALSLTGVVVATAIGVAFTAAARSPEAPATRDETIALVSPRASSTPETVEPSIEATGSPLPAGGPQPSSSGRPSSGRGSGSGDSSGRGPGSPASAARPAAAGDTRGDGTPEDGDNDDDTPDDDNRGDDGDDDHRGHGGDDGEKSNSGPGNYENPGRSNSGGDDD